MIHCAVKSIKMIYTFNKYCILVLLITQSDSYTTEIKLSQGKLVGTREGTVFDGRLYHVFYGVPYAQPPVGNLRFKDPKPPKKWNNTYDATVDYHGVCAQAHIVHKHALHGVEDCLYMNIHTPMLPNHPDYKLKPVLLFIHGYAFTSSLSHIYGADFLIDKDIIFITVTHRVGVFGFLKINDTDTNINMGLKDIVMAIKWVRKNIKHFGGDKTKITVMGSDSGATFLSLLLMTKHRKLFSKIILQSGSVFSPSLFQSDYKIERERLKKNLKRMGLKNILTASTKDIISASQKIYSTKEFINFQKPVVPFTPILEEISNSSLLVFSPDDFYKNQVKENINNRILIGFNSRESIPELIPFIHNPQYLKSFASYFKFMIPFSDGCIYNYTSKSYTEVANKIKSYYFKDAISEKSLDGFLQYTTDLKIYPIWKFIHTYLNFNKSNIFVYKFNYVGAFNAVRSTSLGGVNTKVKGAANGDELCYILNCAPYWENYANIYNDTNNRDRIFIREITELWANFVKTGNPTPNSHSRSIVWQPMTPKQTNILLLAKDTKLVNSNLETKMFMFWNKVYKSIYSKNNCMKHVHSEL